MFELAINIMIYAFWIAFIGGPVTLFLMRLYYVYSHKLKGKVATLILALPLSLGFYYYQPESTKYKTAYKILSGFFFAAIVIASLFMIYEHK
ncbi:MAG: hypothetical protein NTV44_05365 [Firmicutes bacterium]|nr:hypothetical protein [Bacillota bacterium]